VAGDGAPKLFTKGVPVALLPNTPISGVVAAGAPAIEGTGVKGPGFLGTGGPDAEGYLVLNAGIPGVPAEYRIIIIIINNQCSVQDP
jgi:hypothetical protein